MTAVLVVVVPLVLAVFADQMERLESAVLPAPAPGPDLPDSPDPTETTVTTEDPAVQAVDLGTDIRADVSPLPLPAEEVTSTR